MAPLKWCCWRPNLRPTFLWPTTGASGGKGAKCLTPSLDTRIRAPRVPSPHPRLVDVSVCRHDVLLTMPISHAHGPYCCLFTQPITLFDVYALTLYRKKSSNSRLAGKGGGRMEGGEGEINTDNPQIKQRYANKTSLGNYV